MLESERIDIITYRLKTAQEDYEAAEALIELGMLKASMNRAYYSIFHAMRAVLAIEGVDYKRHSGVISHFHQHYINTGK